MVSSTEAYDQWDIRFSFKAPKTLDCCRCLLICSPERRAMAYLRAQVIINLKFVYIYIWNADTLIILLNCRLKEWGFEKGWGDSAKRVKETYIFAAAVLFLLFRFYGRFYPCLALLPWGCWLECFWCFFCLVLLCCNVF